MKWTALKIARPNAFVTVLLAGDGCVESGYVTAGGEPRWHNRVLNTEGIEPTHWMPVPKSPKKTSSRKGKK